MQSPSLISYQSTDSTVKEGFLRPARSSEYASTRGHDGISTEPTVDSIHNEACDDAETGMS